MKKKYLREHVHLVFLKNQDLPSLKTLDPLDPFVLNHLPLVFETLELVALEFLLLALSYSIKGQCQEIYFPSRA